MGFVEAIAHKMERQIMTKIAGIGFKHLAVLLMAFVPVGACAKPIAQTPPSGQARAGAGGVTMQQFQQRQEKKLLAADTDGDGRISKAEFIAAAKAGKGDPGARFAKFDRNGDGMLDRSEIDALAARRFKRLDADGDGVATAQERAAAHAKKGKTKGGVDS